LEYVAVVIVGGGQAGFATSHELTQAGVEHVVLERGRIGQAWRDRWDSFCLVTPNWMLQLPGGPYRGDDPDGYLPRDEIVSYLQEYAAGFGAPVRTGVEVLTLRSMPRGGFIVETSAGPLQAECVVLSTGAYQRSYRPAGADTLPSDLLQIDVGGYQNPATLPEGRVLIVGSGQSGCQIAEELTESGREVVLSAGRCPWGPRRLGGRDIAWWLLETGFLDAPVASLPTPAARLVSNILATGHGGGHDLHLRTLQAMGVTLVGHFRGATDRAVHFTPDLDESVAWGDERYQALMERIRKTAAERGLPHPDIREPEPFDPRAPEQLSLTGFGAVIFAGGFRPDYRSWLPWPEAFDELGFPIHEEGASTAVDGLYFVGVHFLRKRKSSLLIGVGEDAAIVARAIAKRRGSNVRGPRPAAPT
jgi:putative flavoprotein involved in K+ transport